MSPRPLDRHARAACVGALVACLVSCGTRAEAPGPPLLPPAPPTSDVVAARLAALDPELALPPAPEEADPEQVRGLLALAVGRDAELRAVAREEAAGLGDAALPELARLLADEERPGPEREAAVELIAGAKSVRAATILLEVLETSKEPWQRAHAAWRLAETGQDWVVPRMLLRFKYETDFDTVIWIARTLAHYGNDTGLSVLRVVAGEATDATLRDSALARREEIAREQGAPSADVLERAWRLGTAPALPQPPRSTRFDREVLRWVDRFREFQLRGVDDGRFVLERMGTRAAELLADCLGDENRYVRLHVAQSLKRMGLRARPAGEALLARLADPILGPVAAEALGAIGYAPAEPVLASVAAHPTPPGISPDLALAALRALGGFSPSDPNASLPQDALLALRSWKTDRALATSPECAQAAGESLLRLGQTEEAVPRLVELLTHPELEVATTETLLREWLVACGDEALLARWDEAGVPAGAIVPTAERAASHAARQALLEGILAGR